ncbi:hypothetical protein A2U01_0041717, partial [Trifolium medium]|nr:hypothetical protein [Trifolium medium]
MVKVLKRVAVGSSPMFATCWVTVIPFRFGAVITECGFWNEDEWNWRFPWNGDLAQDEIEAAAELTCLLTDISPNKD